MFHVGCMGRVKEEVSLALMRADPKTQIMRMLVVFTFKPIYPKYFDTLPPYTLVLEFKQVSFATFLRVLN